MRLVHSRGDEKLANLGEIVKVDLINCANELNVGYKEREGSQKQRGEFLI